jgi:tyrosine-protein kinase Etk/Wzc
MRVLHAHGTDEPLALTISSPAAGEGKSFISMNLALSFAYAGYETLLIDGDVRRGVLHRVLDVARRPGLTDVLTGSIEPDAAIRTTAYGNLSFLSAGTWMQSAPELLLSNRLRELLAGLRSRFRVIIVDSPPLMAGTDPLVLATVTGKLMLVLRSGSTDLSMASAKLDVIDTLPVRVIGAVLNRVRGDGAFRYYTYGLKGYEQIEEENALGEDGPIRVLGGRP